MPTIVFLGGEGVGKTSLISRYIKDHFPKEHDPTIEDSHEIKIKYDENENEVEFKILDTGGEEQIQNMLEQWISHGNGFILVFSVNDSKSLNALKKIVELINNVDKDKLPKVLVGNKTDLEREVSPEKGEEFARNIKAKYFEISSMNDSTQNINDIFNYCAKKILNKNSVKYEEYIPCRCIII